jgi:hypothetical protein
MTSNYRNDLSSDIEWIKTVPFHFGDLSGVAALRGCYNRENISKILRRLKIMNIN